MNRQYKIRQIFRAPKIGMTESADWLDDADYVHRIAALAHHIPELERVEIIMRVRRPNGRWGKHQIITPRFISDELAAEFKLPKI